MRRRVGVIGGTGLYSWRGGEPLAIDTPDGPVEMTHDRRRDHDLFFVPRHGSGHEHPAHAVDARANVRAMRAAKVDWLVGVFNVGAVRKGLPRASWLVLADFLEPGVANPQTLFGRGAYHANLNPPFCPHLRGALVRAGPRGLVDGGVYVSVRGPRLDTAAENGLYRNLGADVVGMTLAAEATLAREAGLCYAAIAFAANTAGDDGTAQDIQAALARRRRVLERWLDRAPGGLPGRKTCRCQRLAPRALRTVKAA